MFSCNLLNLTPHPVSIFSERPAKVVKLDNSEEYYVIDHDAEAMEEEEDERASSQNDAPAESDTSRAYSGKKLQRYRPQWEEHPALKSEWMK